MPYFCRSLISQALNHGAQKSLKGARILVLGVSYKSDIDDVRESPAEKIIQLLVRAGSDVEYHDPHVPEFDGMRSADYAPENYDCVVIVTAHSTIDYDDLIERSQIVVDLRNATGRNGSGNGKVWKL
jgi:UDP-N-acetyl-D-glucosamine dehydrogenase